MMHEPVHLAPCVGQRFGRRVQVRGVDEPPDRAGRPQDREPSIDRRRESAGELAPAGGQRRLEPAPLADRAGRGDEYPGHGTLDEVTASLGAGAGRGASRMPGGKVHPVGGRRDHRVEQAQLVHAGKGAQALPDLAPYAEREQPHEPAPVTALGGPARLKVLDDHPRPDIAQRREDDPGPLPDPVLGLDRHGTERPRGVSPAAALGGSASLRAGTAGQPVLDLVEPAAPGPHRAVPIRHLEAHEQMGRQSTPQPRRRPRIA